MARRRRTSAFEDMVELASRLPWWLALALAFLSYLVLHAYATSSPPSVVDPRQMGQHLTSSMLRGLAAAGQYFLPFVFICGAIGSIFARYHRRKLHKSVVSAYKPGQIIDGISWQEFELLIGEEFRRNGYTVIEHGGRGPDGGVDLVLRKNGEKYLVQCKHWRSLKVGVSVVREIYGLMAADGAVGAYVVTSGEFTDEAKRFSVGRNVVLLDGVSLAKIFKANSSVVNEVKKPICPRCQIPMVVRVSKSGRWVGTEFWGCVNYPGCKAIVTKEGL